MIDNNEFLKTAGTVLGSVMAIGTAAYAGWVKYVRKDKVDAGNAALDLTSLDAAGKQVLNMSNDLQRMRQEYTDAMALANQRMDALQARLDAAQHQLDEEMVRRRTAEDVIARLRAQIHSLGQEPVA